MAIHHGTIRKYTAALLNMFNELEIQYDDSTSTTITKSIPCTYSSKEKSRILDDYTSSQLAAGNTNVLPRATIALSTMTKSEQRVSNKNNRINTVSKPDAFEFMYNSIPYDFTFELTVMCRGMNEATQIIEQIVPNFNPVYNLDIWEVDNLDEPTRVPLKLLDISIEADEYTELSSNIITVNAGLSLTGNLYPPIKTIPRIKEFKMYLNEQIGDKFNRGSILGWDVDAGGNTLNGTITNISDTTTYAPVLIDIVSFTTVIIGDNNFEVIFDDEDNKITELTFDWNILSGPATITSTDFNFADINISANGNVDIQVTVTDAFGNFATINKVFVV